MTYDLIEGQLILVDMRWIPVPELELSYNTTLLTYLQGKSLTITATSNVTVTYTSTNTSAFDITQDGNVFTVTTTGTNLTTTQNTTTITFKATSGDKLVTKEVTITLLVPPSVNDTSISATEVQTKKDAESVSFTISTYFPVSITVDGTYVTGYSIAPSNPTYVDTLTTYTVTLTIDKTKFVSKQTYTLTISTGYAGINKLFSYAITNKQLDIYGVYVNVSSTSPAVTRIATDMDLHRTLPVHEAMRPCNIDSSTGAITYLNKDLMAYDIYGVGVSTPSTSNHYNAMMELPEFWLGIATTSNNSQYIVISLEEFTTEDFDEFGYSYARLGITHMPKRYVGIYEGVLDSNYTLRSVCGHSPTRSTTGSNFHNYCRKNNTSNKNWNMLTSSVHSTILILFLIEYATRNSLDGFNSILTAEGYHQGGLGTGWTSVSSPQTNTQIANCNTVGGNNVLISYRGIINPFGNCYKELIDIYQQNANVYSSSNKSSWNRNSNPEYQIGGGTWNNSGYVKTVNYNVYNGVLSAHVYDVGGSYSTYWTDYYYFSDSTCGYFIGSYYGDGSTAGLWYLYANLSVGTSNSLIGCRLTYLPYDPE